MTPAVDCFCIQIPLPPMSKARPRFVAQGAAFMPANYSEWSAAFREEARKEMRHLGRSAIETPVRMKLLFRGPKPPRGDLDNLVGGVLDALQPTRKDPDPVVLKDDRLVRYPFTVDFEEAGEWETWCWVEVLKVEEKKGKRKKA